MRLGRFSALGLLIPDLRNPFYTSFAHLLEIDAEKAGYDLVLESWRMNLSREKHCLINITERQVDGAATFLSDNETHRPFLEEQSAKRRAFVAMSITGGKALPVDCVLTDFSVGLREPLKHSSLLDTAILCSCALWRMGNWTATDRSFSRFCC